MAHKRWTSEEDKDILDNYEKYPKQYFADRYGVKPNTIYHRRKALLTNTTKKNTVYTRDDEKYILDNWQTMKAREMSAVLGVSVRSLNLKIYHLKKLGHDIPPKHWNKGRGASPIGTIKNQTIKCADGKWRYYPVQERKIAKKGEGKRYVPVVKKPKVENVKIVKVTRVKIEKVPKPKVVKVKNQQVIKPKLIKVAAPKRFKKEPEKFEIKTKDYSNGTWVKRDNKTYVFKTAS